MNCVLFAKMDQVFSKENKTLKKYWKIGKNTGKVREFYQSGKVGTLKSLCPNGICDGVSDLLPQMPFSDITRYGVQCQWNPLASKAPFTRTVKVAVFRTV